MPSIHTCSHRHMAGFLALQERYKMNVLTLSTHNYRSKNCLSEIFLKLINLPAKQNRMGIELDSQIPAVEYSALLD